MKKRILSLILSVALIFECAPTVFAADSSKISLSGYVGETCKEQIFSVPATAIGLTANTDNIKNGLLSAIATGIKPVIEVSGSNYICYLQYTGNRMGTCELDYSISYKSGGKAIEATKHVTIKVSDKRVEDAKEAVENKVSDVKDDVSSAANSAYSAAGEAWNSASQKADDMLTSANEFMETAKAETTERLNDAKATFLSWYGTAKDAAIYVYDEASNETAEGYAKASAKAEELIGNASDYIEELKNGKVDSIQYASFDSEHPVKDLAEGCSFDETDSIIVGDTSEVEQFAAFYISSVLAARGYSVYNGAVYYKDDVYGGLIFTKNEAFIQENNKTIYSCGFVQLIPEKYKGIKITDEIVQSGLIAVSTAIQGEDAKSFIVDEYAELDSFSGIFENRYFRYKQLDNYVVEVAVKDNNTKNYDSKIELYDFDKCKYVKVVEEEPTEVEQLYKENPDNFTGAVTTVNAIADLAENSAEYDETATIFVLDGNTLDTILALADEGPEKVTDFVRKCVRGIKLKSSQYLSINSDGTSTIYGSEKEIDEGRVTDGIISTVGSGLGAAGSVASIVVACIGGQIVIKAIIITVGTMAIVYNISNLIEGIENIYYGANNDTTAARNPVLLAFKKAIPDEKTAELVYHIWGAGSTILTNMLVPVGNALNMAKCTGLSTFKTCTSVVRASVTYMAKLLAAGVGSSIVNNYVSKVVTKVSGDQYLGKLVGFGTCLVSGMLIYKGLDAIDKSLNVSGLYPKETVLETFKAEQEAQTTARFKRGRVSNQQRGEDEQLVQSIADIVADDLGIEESPTIKIVYDSKSSVCGSYNNKTNILEVNMRNTENTTIKGLADTIAHEMRHTYQLECLIYDTDGVSYEVKMNLMEYISPSSSQAGYNSYATQPCEVDAQTYAAEFSDRFVDMLVVLAAA